MSTAGFHLLRPLWLLALAPLALLLWRLARRRLGGGRWTAVCDPALLPHLLLEGGEARRRWPLAALGLAGLLAVIALAGPVWQRLPQPAFRDRSGLVIVLDLSPAMDAGDLKPSRLERARFKIADLLKARREGQTALVVFAGAPFTVTPLTTDIHTIDSQLGALGTDLMPSAGRRADLALDRAAALLHQGGLRQGDVLLLTAGADLKQAEPAARRLRQAGYRLSVLGVGTPQGAPVPMPGGGFLQGAGGQIALSALAESDLQQLATAGGGIYRTLRSDDADLNALLALFHHRLPVASKDHSTMTLDTWREEGPWLLLPLLLLAPLAFRRGVLGLILLLLVLPAPARAFDWSGLWTRPDQLASRQLARGEGTPEAGVFRDPAWRAAALYRVRPLSGGPAGPGRAGRGGGQLQPG